MNNVSRTKRHNQKIAYTGAGLYRWNKNNNQWDRCKPIIERTYHLSDDKRSFGLVKIFSMANVI